MLREKRRELGSSRRHLRWAKTCSWSFHSSIQVVSRRFGSDGRSNRSRLETGIASFWFAKILRVTEAEAHLIQLEPVAGEANAYRANMRSVWAEPICAVHVVDGSYDERAGFYSLRTSVADILKLLE